MKHRELNIEINLVRAMNLGRIRVREKGGEKLGRSWKVVPEMRCGGRIGVAMVGDSLNRSAGHLKKLLSNTVTLPFSGVKRQCLLVFV